MRRSSALLFTLLVAPLVVDCAQPGWWKRPGCPVVPVSSRELPGDLELRARIYFEIGEPGERDPRVEVVARAAPEGLTVVGIARYGARVFAVRQRERAIEVESATTAAHEHLARWTLDALHRTVWIQPPPDPGIGAVVSWSREGESVTESREVGKHTRVFSRSGAPEHVLVRYRERGAQVQNPWCGYRATIAFLDAPGDA